MTWVHSGNQLETYWYIFVKEVLDYKHIYCFE